MRSNVAIYDLHFTIALETASSYRGSLFLAFLTLCFLLLLLLFASSYLQHLLLSLLCRFFTVFWPPRVQWSGVGPGSSSVFTHLLGDLTSHHLCVDTSQMTLLIPNSYLELDSSIPLLSQHLYLDVYPSSQIQQPQLDSFFLLPCLISSLPNCSSSLLMVPSKPWVILTSFILSHPALHLSYPVSTSCQLYL